MTDSAETVHLWVTGRVQGVGFRYFIEREAQRLGLSGWVRNLPDGRVEIEASGARDALAQLAAAARTGPALSRVTDVTERRTAGAPAAGGFRVRHDLA